MSRYIFEPNVEDKEYHRLRMIEAARDSFTIPLLERIGIQQGWKCLEIGPGAGSILRWLGKKVGKSGLVIGVDKKPVHLQQCSSPPYDIRKGDFLEVGFNVPLDLVYSRYCLIHNKDNTAFLHKIHEMLQPNGYVVLEEPDFTSAKLLNTGSDTPHGRVNAAICKMFLDYGLDPGYGLRLPQHLHNVGFQILETHPTIHLCEGKSPIANLMAESACVLSQEYQKTGEASAEDIHEYVANAHTPDFWTVYYSTISIIAQPRKS